MFTNNTRIKAEAFERHASALKKMKLDSNGAFHETNKNAIEASYYIALEIPRQKKAAYNW